MREAGLENVIAMTKPITEWDNINDAVAAFNRCSFNRTLCEEGITSLDAYHSKVETDGVTIRNVPVHDWSSHASTAFGYSHQAIRSGLLADRSAIPSKPRKLVPRMPDGSIPVARTYVQEKFQKRRQDGARF